MQDAARRRAIAGLIALGIGCTRPRTEIVAVVSTDLSWGPDQRVQSVVLTARRDGSTGTVIDTRTTALGVGLDLWTLPLSVGIVRADEADFDPIWIEVLGCAAADGCTVENAVVAQRAVVGFSPEQTLELPLHLAAGCASTRCMSDERCNDASVCEFATLAQSMLGTTDNLVPGDAGPIDTGDLDGGTMDDVAVVDQGTPGDGGVACLSATMGCSSAAECCAEASCRPTPVSASCCFEVTHACGMSAECCGNMTCVGGFCACQPVGASCSADADCCTTIGHTCSAGVCIPG